MIPAAEVIRRIETYYEGGTLAWLSAAQFEAAQRGVRSTAANPFDGQRLTLSGAGMACERFIAAALPEVWDGSTYAGRGVVICGGGAKYFTCAWVCIRMLRKLGCALPIELWHLGRDEWDERMEALVAPFHVTCVDASKTRARHPARRLGGWALKPYAMLHSRFRDVLLLDADNVPVVNPEFLFETKPYRSTGAIFWPDYGRLERTAMIWRSCGMRRPPGPEFESGQMVVDKGRCGRALRLALWFNEHDDFYYRYLHGDKETFHLAFRKLKQKFAMIPTGIQGLTGTMCQHDFDGRRIFQHRNTAKWTLLTGNRRVRGFRWERDCLTFLEELRVRWDGRVNPSRGVRK
jgi:hypothetical protein